MNAIRTSSSGGVNLMLENYEGREFGGLVSLHKEKLTAIGGISFLVP
jgi:hypothetical protein